MLLIAYKDRQLVTGKESTIKVSYTLLSCRLTRKFDETLAGEDVFVVYVVLYRRNMARIGLHMCTELIYGNRVANPVDEEDCFNGWKGRCPYLTVKGYIEAGRSKPEILTGSIIWSVKGHVDSAIYPVPNPFSCLSLALCSRELQELQEFIHLGRVGE